MQTKFRNRKRLGVTSVLAVAVTTTMSLGALAPAAHAQPAPGLGGIVTTPAPPVAGPSPIAPPAPPKYKIEAIKFKADDESGVDWLGSDEPYWIFNSSPGVTDGNGDHSHVFQDVDTGETRTFPASERCVFGGSGCAGAPAAPDGIDVNAALWESDSGSGVPQQLLDATRDFFLNAGFDTLAGGIPLAAYLGLNPALFPVLLYGGAAAFAVAGICYGISTWLKDDPLGSQTLKFSPDTLAQRLPRVGNSFSFPAVFGGAEGGTTSDAQYTLTLKVTRTA